MPEPQKITYILNRIELNELKNLSTIQPADTSLFNLDHLSQNIFCLGIVPEPLLLSTLSNYTLLKDQFSETAKFLDDI